MIALRRLRDQLSLTPPREAGRGEQARRLHRNKLKRADYHCPARNKGRRFVTSGRCDDCTAAVRAPPRAMENSARGRRTWNDHHGIATGFSALTLNTSVPRGSGCAGTPSGSGRSCRACCSGVTGWSGRSGRAWRAGGPGYGNRNHRRRSHDSRFIACAQRERHQCRWKHRRILHENSFRL